MIFERSNSMGSIDFNFGDFLIMVFLVNENINDIWYILLDLKH
jgi:hypothetical protein